MHMITDTEMIMMGEAPTPHRGRSNARTGARHTLASAAGAMLLMGTAIAWCCSFAEAAHHGKTRDWCVHARACRAQAAAAACSSWLYDACAMPRCVPARAHGCFWLAHTCGLSLHCPSCTIALTATHRSRTRARMRRVRPGCACSPQYTPTFTTSVPVRGVVWWKQVQDDLRCGRHGVRGQTPVRACTCMCPCQTQGTLLLCVASHDPTRVSWPCCCSAIAHATQQLFTNCRCASLTRYCTCGTAHTCACAHVPLPPPPSV